MVESPSGVPDLYEIILALDDFEDGGGVAAAVPCLDFDPAAFEIRREGAGVAPPVRAPGVVRKAARSESGDRFSRREFGRLGRVRSSRSWRAASSCNLAAGPVVELAGWVWEYMYSPDVFMILINFWTGGN